MGSFHSFIHFKLSLLKADGSYSLYGYKWFSSATDSDMSLTLARVVDNQVKMTKALPTFKHLWFAICNLFDFVCFDTLRFVLYSIYKE